MGDGGWRDGIWCMGMVFWARDLGGGVVGTALSSLSRAYQGFSVASPGVAKCDYEWDRVCPRFP